MNKVIDNIYICSTLLLCILTYLLNSCTAIYQCALVFTIIAITTNAVTFTYGKLRSLKVLAFAIALNFVLLGKLPYYINGKIVNGLVCASFISLMISMYLSNSVFQKLVCKFNFVVASALSLTLAAVIDGLIMSLFFALNNHFTYARLLDIFSKELSYKILYELVAAAIMFVVLKMFKTRKKLNNNLNI